MCKIYTIHGKTFELAGLLVVRCELCPHSELYDTLQAPRLVLYGQWVTSSGEMMELQVILDGYCTFQSLVQHWQMYFVCF